MEISGCWKIKICQKNDSIAKTTPILVPSPGIVVSTETVVMTGDQDLIFIRLKIRVNNMKKIQYESVLWTEGNLYVVFQGILVKFCQWGYRKTFALF